MSDFKKLPVICSIGGINSAGRTSNEMSYKRMVFNNLDSELKKEVITDLDSISDVVRSK